MHARAEETGRPLDVVVVDDHPMWRDTMAQVIQRYEVGRVVAQAGSGPEALSVLGVTKPDVVVMDVDMPGMDGVEVTRRLRARGIDARVLFLSSFDDREKVLGAVTAGASGYLLKTTGAAGVAKAIRRIAAGELVFPPHLADVLLQAVRGRGDGAVGGSLPGSVPPPPGAAGMPPPPVSAALVREGDIWSLTYAGTTVHLPDLKGIRYLVELIRARGREVMALDLMMKPAGTARVTASREDDLAPAGGGIGPLLDGEAKRAYRRRIQDLQEEIEEATDFNDPERAARAREELQQLTAHLSAAVGIGGRDRPTSSDVERARVAVTRSIRRAIDKLVDAHPGLASHLDAAVSTGTFCRYAPDQPVDWTL